MDIILKALYWYVCIPEELKNGNTSLLDKVKVPRCSTPSILAGERTFYICFNCQFLSCSGVQYNER